VGWTEAGRTKAGLLAGGRRRAGPTRWRPTRGGTGRILEAVQPNRGGGGAQKSDSRRGEEQDTDGVEQVAGGTHVLQIKAEEEGEEP
jgi:hypothetical protein